MNTVGNGKRRKPTAKRRVEAIHQRVETDVLGALMSILSEGR